MIQLISPYNGEKVELHTKIQAEFIRRIEKDGIMDTLEWLRTFKKDQELTYPAAVRFQWNTDQEESVLELSEDKDFQNIRTFQTKESTCEIDNLKIGQQYFWRVNKGEPFVFETAKKGPRFIRIDGALNVRDIGGDHIRQGILYRGSELNGMYNITEEGKKTFCDILGIKTELDLRGEQYGKFDQSPAGERVRLIQIPYRPYKESFEEQHKEKLREIMELLADETNYPVYFHCMGGADRTGMIAIFLRVIAGEKEEDIHMDYEVTSLSSYAFAFNSEGFRYRTAPWYVEFLDMLAEYAPGESFEVQILKFLDSCGVTKNCREKIKKILKPY